MLEEVASLAGDAYVSPAQGSYSTSVGASAGTHSSGGAVDLGYRHLTEAQRHRIVREMRRVGFAAWYRREIKGLWPPHCHAIAIGCPDLAPGARQQVEAYRAGRNGLAGNGADDGPRDWVNVTWESYKKGRQDMGLTREDKEWLVKLIDNRVGDAVLAARVNDPLGNGGRGEEIRFKGLIQRIRRKQG
jgi:hypothetical protein